ncbi:YajG family lipoprotein [Glaesserella sp.]|uniref:YajG family lipoprotein n=1 Tax=Glaesserella sp. TaxID=2094731 RepID=UPI0035A13922
MKLTKKALFITTFLAASVLVGCQSQSNTLTLTTPSPTAAFNTNNQTALVNVSTQDMRPSAEVASYTSGGNVVRLNAIPDVTQLFQQVMQQNLNSKGFGVVQGAGNANITVNVKKFFADVEQGNLRHKITANVGVEVVVQGGRGNFSKVFNTSRSYEGALGADNADIQKVLNQAYNDAVLNIYNDNEIGNAIHQFK